MFTALDIVKVVYSTTPSVLWGAAAINVSHHLEKLFKENKVVCTKGGYKAKL